MKKLKNVLNGYLSQENIDRLIIIDGEGLEPLYSGTLADFQNAPDFMEEFKKGIRKQGSYKSRYELWMPVIYFCLSRTLFRHCNAGRRQESERTPPRPFQPG